jgi:hypothetical protein
VDAVHHFGYYMCLYTDRFIGAISHLAFIPAAFGMAQ